ncbi:MAG: FKBP-type peptidyl-prolyl cis-trans isomerase [Gemmatimonadaceae bacterium]
MRRRAIAALAAAMLLATTACNSGSAVAPADVDPTTIAYAAPLGVDFASMTKSATGLWEKDVATGTGPAAADGDIVTVKYRGYLPDGTDFSTLDASRDAASYTLGSRALIRGFSEGVVGMKAGGKRRLVIRPSLGYGINAIGIIPASSVLVFDVELISIGAP